MRASDIYYFVQGYIRYGLVKMFGFYILREHISEQIIARGMSADRRCVKEGRCKICGCHTPALFYADKSCDRPCYPKMMSKEDWLNFVRNGGNSEWNFYGMKFYRVKGVIDGE